MIRFAALSKVFLATSILAGASLPLAAGESRTADAPQWRVDQEASRIVFVASQSGAPVEGRFANFTADIRFDPAAPESGGAEVIVEIASVESGAADRDQTIVSEGLLNAAEFPQGRFVAENFRHLGGDRYEAPGNLTLRGVTLPAVLPFTLTLSEGKAHAVGELTLQRLDYGIGQGQWKDPSAVGPEVKIRIDVRATRAE